MTLVVKGSSDDTIQTGDQSDLIISGSGDDTIDAGDGNNVVISGKGDDTITSGDGNDLIVSGKGDDTIDAGDGDNVILSGKGDDTVTTGDGDDLVVSGKGDDTIDAGDGDNTVLAGKGNDEVTTGSGDDKVITGSGNDEVSLGGGNDTAYLGSGDDKANFVWSENTASSSTYHGQSGCDTFRFILTSAEAQDPDVIADLQAFEAHIASGSCEPFKFTSIDLTVTGFEKIELIAPVVAMDDTAATQEDGSSITIDVLGNDEDLLAVDNSALTVTGFDDTGIPAGASLALNPDNTFTFDPGTAFQELAEGEQIEITFAYTVADDQGFEDVATVTITITGTNDAPTITSGVQSGLITEIADGAPGETIDSHSANGAVTYVDVDLADTHSASFLPQSGGYLGTFSLDPVDQGADSVGWNFSIDDADIDYLAAGETLVQSYDVTVDDGNGGTVLQTVTVTIMGTNDDPTITSGTQTEPEPISEIADGAAGETVDSHSVNGAVNFADDDLADTHSASFLPQAGGYLGTFSLDPVDQGADSVAWSFSIDDADIDYLAAGETLVQSYDVTVDDGNGGTVLQTVEITIMGTNDAPTITSGAQSALITEIADGAPGETIDSHSANGAVTFADVDLADTHSAGFVPQAGGYLGTFSLYPVDQGVDSVGWNFSIDDADIDYLAAGETLVQSYDVTVDDGNGGTAMQTVEITITGTNDAPTITSGAQSGLITEIADGAPGEAIDSHNANGAVTYADVDLADTHSASFLPQAGGYLGTFSLDPVDQGADSVGWNFSIDDADIDYLAAGETLVQSYDVTVDDGNGGTAMQTVEITIMGTNDAPTITSGVQSGLITEIADGAPGETIDSHSANGAATFADVDLADTHSAGFVPQAGGYLGTFSLDPVDQGVDSVGWNFSIDDADIDYLAAGETLVQSYDVTVDDGNGGTVLQTVEITIMGTNDAPTITSGAQSGLITEIADGAPGETIDSHSANGAVTYVDVDLADTHSASFLPQAGGYLGTFNLDPVDQGADSVGWNFSIDDADIDYLAAGETLVQSYDVTVDDGNGGTVLQTVTVTIMGTNDDPTITSGTQTEPEPISEIADGAAGEAVDSHSANGAVTFADDDLADTHSAGFVPQAGGYLGTFSLDPVDQGGDSVAWNFSIDDADIDYLAAGETLVQSYDVTVDDGNGGTVLQTVEITITGTNDAPTITSGAQSALITEIADGAPGETVDSHSANGAVTYADVDLADTHSAGFVPQAGGYLGTFSLDPVDQGADSVGWSFAIDDADIDYLAAGETLVQSYDVTVDDGNGGTAMQTVEITITGTNDAPTITSGAQSGLITEIADGAPGETIDSHSANGAVTYADVDLADTHSAGFVPQAGGYLGTFSLDPVDQGADSVGWNFSIDDADIDYLAAGETLVQSYDVTVDDGNGGTVLQTVEITITGTNDAPTITSGTQAEPELISEIADGAAGEAVDSHSVNGAVNFADDDLADTHSAGFVPQAGGYLGTFSLDPVDQGADSVGWNFSIDDADIDYLAAGETLVQSYDVTVDDGNGGTVLQTVEITITGTNDAPTITSGAQSGLITEIADGAPGETIDSHNANGAVTFADVDLADTHSAGFVPQAGGYLGTFSLDPVDQGADSVGWNFSIDDADIDYLAAGETLVQSYDVTVDDGNGGTVLQTVEITITGTNDAPTITSGAQSGLITEIADGAPGETIDSHSANGAVTFADVDLADTHSAGFVPQAGGYLGTFSLDPVDQGVDSVGWNFSIDDADIDYLAAGETLVQSYDVTVDDGNGGTAMQTVEVTITGTNDAPTITSGAQSGLITEIADGAPGETIDSHSANGAVTYVDVDLADTHSASFLPQAGGYLGTFSLDPVDQGADSVGWSFAIDDADIDYLAAGETLVQSYDVTVDDGNGGTAMQTVEITITGTNDAPTITSGAQSALITEIADGAPGEAIDSHSANGEVTFADVDLADTHSASFLPQAGGYLGTFSLDPVDQGADSVGWNFSIDDADIDYLAAGETLVQSYDVTVDDGNDGTAMQTVEITITGTDDDPIVTDSIAATNSGQAVSGMLTASDVDVADTLTFSLDIGPSNGTVTILPDGSYTYTPDAGFSGQDSFTFLVDDGSGTPVQGTVTVDASSAGAGQVRYIEDLFDDDQVSSFDTTKDNPEVAALTGGGHIVVWSSYIQTPDGDNWGVFAQRYDSNGDKIGGEFLVNSTTSNAQFDPSVTGIGGGTLDGGFVVVWQSNVQDGSGYGVYAQRYDAGGGAIGGEILVNTTTSSNQIYPTVTALAGGKFAVTWMDQGGADGSSNGVFLKIFNADGTAASGEIQVNQTTLNHQETEGWTAETITTLDDGGFVVSWASYDGNATSERYDAYMRVFNADGTARTSEMQVNTAATNTNNDQRYVSVGALQGTDAGFVVTWSDNIGTDGSGWGVFARVYDKEGNAVGSDFQVNTYFNSTQQFSKVEGLSDGSFVIVWQSYGLDGSNYTISGQRFDGSGNKMGGEFLVPESSFSNEYEPSIALRDDGALVVVWEADNHRIEQKIITDFATDVRDIEGIEDDEQVSSIIAPKDNPEVTALTGGGHIVVWSSYIQTPDGDNWGVFAQRYDASGDKIGSEFLVNTTTSSAQHEPSVAGLNGGTLDGGFVVVWQSYPQDGSGNGVYAQRFDAGGSAVGGEILVNTTTSSNQIYPTVTALAGGKFAVTWTDQGGADGSGNGVFLKIFNADGTAASGEIQVNQTTLNSQDTDGWNAETITTLDDGGFVVSWASYDGNATSERWDAYMRIFNADGTARTGEMQVNTAATNTNNDQRYVSVGALQGTDAGFVVTWSDNNGTDGSSWGVFARVYDKDGNAIGNDFQVNTYFNSTQIYSKVEELSDGSFVIVWQSYGLDGSNYTISGQRFDASGNKIGGEFLVPESSFSNETEPSITLRDDGALVVVWEADNHRIEQKIITDFANDVRDIGTIDDDEQVSSFGAPKDTPEVAALTGGGHIVVWSSLNQAPDGDGYGVFAQRYDTNGDKIGSEFLVNSTTSNDQFDPSVAGLNGGTLDGGFVVVWQANVQDGSGYGVYAQRFDAGGSATGGEILVNTTTSGNQVYPTVTALAGGKFAVTWTDQGGADGSASGVFLKIFNADGTAASGEIQVNQTTFNSQETDGWNAETITTLDDGGFVVSWASYDGNATSERWDAYMRIFNADGTARTGEMQVNTAATNTNNDQRYVSVGALQGTDAGFVVTWSDNNGTDGSGWGVFARVYDKDGSAIGNDFQVNTYVNSTQQFSKVEGLSDGSFVIVWQSYGLDGSNSTISGQRFDASGNKIGGEFLVPESSFSNETEPSIALRDDGALIVVWEADNNRIEQKIITDFGTGSVAAKTITGTDGNDSLIGSNLDDTLDGAAGNDTIEGLQGNDLLTGGSGADRYVFNAGDGDDTITDFEVGVDGLVLVGGVTITGTSEENRSGDADLDTVVQLSSGDEIVLEDVNGITDPNDLQVV